MTEYIKLWFAKTLVEFGVGLVVMAGTALVIALFVAWCNKKR